MGTQRTDDTLLLGRVEMQRVEEGLVDRRCSIASVIDIHFRGEHQSQSAGCPLEARFEAQFQFSIGFQGLLQQNEMAQVPDVIEPKGDLVFRRQQTAKKTSVHVKSQKPVLALRTITIRPQSAHLKEPVSNPHLRQRYLDRAEHMIDDVAAFGVHVAADLE